MNIVLTSIDDSYVVKSGGKHVHQNLLERGLVENGDQVKTHYYKQPKDYYGRILGKFRKVLSFKRKINKMIKFLNAFNYGEYDIINAHDVVSAVAAEGNIVLTLHGYFANETINYGNFTNAHKAEIYNFSKSIEKKAIEKSDAIITVDSNIKDYVINEFKCAEEKIFTIYNAIDTKEFIPICQEDINIIRKKFDITENSFVILIPRRYVKKNGVKYAAKALKLMKEKDIFMIFIGRGPEKENLKKELQGDKRAVVMNAVSHEKIVDYYKLSDVVLIPSIISDDVEEATSLSMLEGMACGKPVICSNIGGMKEVITSGENGLLVDQRSPIQIVEAIIKLKKNKLYRDKIGNNARKYVVKNHHYIQHASKFKEVYTNVVKKG
ncbi:MAG: glycosyltransferase family 4 protein [Firmicutes bacterium]|nr:glycosyltransferase family 4 protein [Bacillota bacterium]